MISLLITLLLFAIIVYVVYLIIGMVNLPEPIKRIVYIILAVIVLFWLLQTLGVYTLPLK